MVIYLFIIIINLRVFYLKVYKWKNVNNFFQFEKERSSNIPQHSFLCGKKKLFSGETYLPAKGKWHVSIKKFKMSNGKATLFWR